MLRFLKLIFFTSVLILTLGTGINIKIKNKIASLGFKAKVERSFEDFIKIDRSQYKLRVGSVNNNFLATKLKLKDILVTNSSNKVVYSVDELYVGFNPFKVLMNSHAKVSFKAISKNNERLEGKALVDISSKTFKVKKLLSKFKSVHLDTIFKINQLNSRALKWKDNWSGNASGTLTVNQRNSELKVKFNSAYFKVNKKLAKSFSPRPQRKIYKSEISDIHLAWNSNGFRTLRPLKIKVPKLRTTIMANTIAQNDFPDHNLWQIGLYAKKEWNIIFSHMMGCYPNKPTKKYIILNGPQANYCKKLDDVAQKKRRR